MDFLELSKKRFTAKKFDPSKKIPEDDIKKLKEILRLSPSSVNSQPWVFIFGSSDQANKKIRPAVNDFNWPRTDTCSHFVVIAIRDGLSDKYLEAILDQEIKDGRLLSDQIVKEQRESRKYFVGLRDSAHTTLTWEAKQAYIAMTTLLYGSASLGINSTPIEGFEEETMDKILGLDNYGLKSVLLVTLGYDAADDHNATRPKSRLPLDKIIWEMK